MALKRVSVLHHGLYQMMQYRIYQRLLYFQNVIQFQGRFLNVIPFMLIRKVRHLDQRFPQNSQRCEPG